MELRKVVVSEYCHCDAMLWRNEEDMTMEESGVLVYVMTSYLKRGHAMPKVVSWELGI